MLAPEREPTCAECLAHEWPCAFHLLEACAYKLLPLRSNFPRWLMGVTHYDEAQEESAEGKAHRERKARKRAKRSAQARLVAALNGQRTRVAA